MRPVCAWCQRIQDRQLHWLPLNSYLATHSYTQLTHTICPTCLAAIEQRQQLRE